MNSDNYLKCGNFMVPHVMKYCGTAKQDIIDKALTDGTHLLQEKRDGALFRLLKNAEGEVGLFSRTISKTNGEYVNRIDNVPHIREWAERFLPNDTYLEGEIYVPGGHSNDVTSIMGCLPAKAIERQEKQGKVHYYVFDCTRYCGKELFDVPAKDRIGFYLNSELRECFGWFNGFLHDSGSWVDEVELAPAYTLPGHEFEGSVTCEDFAAKLAEIFAAGGEGVVMKQYDSLYRPNKRSTAKQAFKLKEHVDSIDVVIMDLLDPVMEYTGKELDSWPYWIYIDESFDGSSYYIDKCDECEYEKSLQYPYNYKPVTKPYYYGWKNSIKIGAYNESGELISIGTVASGLTDDDRADLAANPDNYIGRVCEVECMSVNKDELTLRHPVLKGFRAWEDKPAADCLLEDIFK